MFSKKTKCKKCGEKISEKYSFCPECGASTEKSSSEDYGMLGKNDAVDPMESLEKGMLGGISGKMLNRMISGTMKMLEKEMQKNMQNNFQKQNNLQPKTNFELYINGKRINPKNIKVTRREVPNKNKNSRKKHNSNHFDEESIKKFTSLPKEEPKTHIRRFSNKVVYEIEVPGVESIKDISVTKLENSIEIRAISKETAYKKTIPIDLPLKRYKLDKEKLILELGVKD